MGGLAVLLEHVLRVELELSGAPQANAYFPLDQLASHFVRDVASLFCWNSPFGIGVGEIVLVWAVLQSARDGPLKPWRRARMALYALAILYALPGIYLTVAWVLQGASLPLRAGELDVEFITEGGMRSIGDVLLIVAIAANLFLVRFRPATAGTPVN